MTSSHAWDKAGMVSTVVTVELGVNDAQSLMVVALAVSYDLSAERFAWVQITFQDADFFPVRSISQNFFFFLFMCVCVGICMHVSV